jgi:hypothetical protein
MDPLTIAAIGIGVGNLVSNFFKMRAEKKAAETQSANVTENVLPSVETAMESAQAILNPYVEAGNTALQQQQALAGTLGPEAQAEAVQQIEQGAQFSALQTQGENAILQNAAATGGLRGGNTQAALAQFRPQLLNELINQRMGQLGGIAGQGLGAAGQSAGLGMQGGSNIANLLLQQGAYDAGGDLATGRFYAGIPGAVSEGLGFYTGIGGGGGI